MQDRGARVGDCPCCPLPRGARVYQIFYVLIVLILTKNYNNRTWQNMAKCLFCTIRPWCRRLASGALDAPFTRFAPPALNNFRHPCECGSVGRVVDGWMTELSITTSAPDWALYTNRVPDNEGKWHKMIPSNSSIVKRVLDLGPSLSYGMPCTASLNEIQD